ncbi:hypothetical protein HBB16_14010 [Pseudonocardia sp. MCCB 268]|nr:hypothetical protein [Pseudonocardia cytotoxica]
MREIERAAGELYREIPGWPWCRRRKPPPAAVLAAYAGSGEPLIIKQDDVPIAYLITEIVDGCAHLERCNCCPACAAAGSVPTWSSTSPDRRGTGGYRR